ncbi:MAG: DUF4287 domain-containing protein, partial [Pseudomonadota bacterium]
MSTPDKQLQTMLENLPHKTGKSLDTWLKLITAHKVQKHGQIVKWLKSEHGVTHGFANLIAAKFNETDEVVYLIATQYSGAKSELKPIHDAIVAFAKTLGQDVEFAPKKASHSLRRKKQFALITPATKTRVDLGVALKGVDPTGRLESYNAMCSHRIRLESLSDFDSEAKDWVRQAYDL